MAIASQILVAASEDRTTVVLKPTGRCTMGICETLHAYLRQLPSLDKADLYVDLSEADFIDSTFTGFLLSLARKKRDSKAPAFHLLRPSEQVLRTLGTMGVRSMFNIRQSIANEPTKWRALTANRPDPTRAADLVIDAHQELVDADACDAEEFARVVKVFRAAQKRERPS